MVSQSPRYDHSKGDSNDAKCPTILLRLPTLVQLAIFFRHQLMPLFVIKKYQPLFIPYRQHEITSNGSHN